MRLRLPTLPRARTLRVAILSTPRCGNTWMRCLLAWVYQLEEVAVHTPAELPSPLPERMVLQLHWHRTDEFQRFLKSEGFRVVTLARDPLDVLVSILHFTRNDATSSRWLDGEGRVDLAGATPTSTTFARFALGEGARALLSVTPEWWKARRVVRARYEQLVEAPEESLRKICRAVHTRREASLSGAIARYPLGFFQGLPNRHGWQGRPGIWRELIPADLARKIHAAHVDAFRALRYPCVPDPDLTPERAEANWAALASPPQLTPSTSARSSFPATDSRE